MTRRYWAPLLVNVLIGIPMTVVVLCARWYAAHGHCDHDDLELRDLDGCSYDQIENSPLVLGALAVTGLLVLLLILIADVLRPRSRRRPLKPGLVTLPAVLLPYALLAGAAA